MADSLPNPGWQPTNPRPRGGIFVGRDREMAELRSALHTAMAGQDSIVMLAGEPEFGKPRTARELAAVAETRGAQVLWGWDTARIKCRAALVTRSIT